MFIAFYVSVCTKHALSYVVYNIYAQRYTMYSAQPESPVSNQRPSFKGAPMAATGVREDWGRAMSKAGRATLASDFDAVSTLAVPGPSPHFRPPFPAHLILPQKRSPIKSPASNWRLPFRGREVAKGGKGCGRLDHSLRLERRRRSACPLHTCAWTRLTARSLLPAFRAEVWNGARPFRLPRRRQNPLRSRPRSRGRSVDRRFGELLGESATINSQTKSLEVAGVHTQRCTLQNILTSESHVAISSETQYRWEKVVGHAVGQPSGDRDRSGVRCVARPPPQGHRASHAAVLPWRPRQLDARGGAWLTVSACCLRGRGILPSRWKPGLTARRGPNGPKSGGATAKLLRKSCSQRNLVQYQMPQEV